MDEARRKLQGSRGIMQLDLYEAVRRRQLSIPQNLVAIADKFLASELRLDNGKPMAFTTAYIVYTGTSGADPRPGHRVGEHTGDVRSHGKAPGAASQAETQHNGSEAPLLKAALYFFVRYEFD